MTSSESLLSLSIKEETEIQAPSTPKKKPKYKDQEKTATRRVKSITKLIEKESTNAIYSFLVFLWSLVIIGIILMTFQAKMKGKEVNAGIEIEDCRKQYQKNRCDNPVKAAIPFCNQKFACMNENSTSFVQRKVSYPELFGQITKQFASGAGIVGVSLGLILIWLCMRQKGKERIAINIQYFDDK